MRSFFSKANLIKSGIVSAVGILVVILFVSSSDFGAQTTVDKYKILCDAFTIPGLLMLMFAAMLSISNEGGLDGISYLVKQGFRMLTFRGISQEKYLDYVQHRRENRLTGYGFLYIVGAAFMVIALIFMALFYTLYNA